MLCIDMSSNSSKHLPLLYNPFLNSLFNNANHSRPLLKHTIQELAEGHNDYTILVPPAHVLNVCYDPSSENSSTSTPLKDLCFYSEEFVRSHIIKTSSSYSTTIAPVTRIQLIIYNTLNGKQILVKNGMVFTGKGFKRSLKLRILHVGYFNSFCDYLPKGAKYMLLYVEDTLIGSYDRNRRLFPANCPPETPLPAAKQDVLVESVTFEELLRSFPLLSSVVSDKFYRLFHHNNHQFRVLRTHTRKKLANIKHEFQVMLDEAFKIVLDSVKTDAPESERTYDLFTHIMSLYPGLDLNRIVHEYVELHLYDKLWSQIAFQFNCPNDDKDIVDKVAITILTTERYNSLSCLSLNELEISVDKPWHVNFLHHRVANAIDEFSRLGDLAIVNLAAKSQIIIDTVNLLTNTDLIPGPDILRAAPNADDVLIDADTLIGLLIMVVVHSKVPNLEAHLYYIKNFSSVNIDEDGYFSYILSNIDAVIYHLSAYDHEELHLSALIQSSKRNFSLWSAIQLQDMDVLIEILDEAEKDVGLDCFLPRNHALCSRNIHGESCLMMAIKTGNSRLFNKLLYYSPSWFTVDDILFDKNTTTQQTLLMVALREECTEITSELVLLILNNATNEEQTVYFNLTDNTGRSVGHYLFHNYHLIDDIGHLIDWELKDLNSHTPLFSMCRCYDHGEYNMLIEKCFECIYKKYGNNAVDFDKHIDKSGNTLLHVIMKGLDKSRLLKTDNLVNVNQVNSKLITPIAQYIKFNRLQNLQDILKDARLDFRFEDPKYFYNVFDYLGFLANKALASNATLKEMEKTVYNHFNDNCFPAENPGQLLALNAKFDASHSDWIITFAHFNDGKYTLRAHHLNSVRRYLQVHKLQYPLSVFPDGRVFWTNHPGEKAVVPFFAKYRINRTIEDLNILFASMNFYEKEQRNEFYHRFLEKPVEDEKLIFEVMKDISDEQERARNDLGEVILTAAQILDIEVFLNFSLNDLVKYQSLMGRLNKLIAVGGVKTSDIRSVHGRAVRYSWDAKILPSGGPEVDLSESRLQESGYSTLLGATMHLETAVMELTRNIGRVLERLQTWRQLYAIIREYNVELRRFEEHHPNGTAEPEADDASVFLTLFSLGNMIESKKARYRKLVQLKSEDVKRIMRLNAEIKHDHEHIASEMSHFLRFRAQMVTYGIKQSVHHTLRALLGRQLELATVLKSVGSRA